MDYQTFKQNQTQFLAFTSLLPDEFETLLNVFTPNWERYYRYRTLEGKYRQQPAYQERVNATLKGNPVKLLFLRVSLQNELEALQLYIELEAMHFKQKVSTRIQIDPGIDQQYVTIPPLLLQPYVWHGLMHKPEGGTVTIVIEQPNEHWLHIEITDDGVGRARAAALKSKSAGKTKSFGMRVTAGRIRMINQLHNTQTKARIFDLVAPDGEPLGTKIVLDIPV